MEQIETKRKLINWIKTHTDCFVYTDSKQSGANGTFKVSGTKGSKPDLLIQNPVRNDGKQRFWNIVVEVKPGSSRELTDAFFQTIRYTGQYLNEDSKYLVNGFNIKIHTFAVATAFSPLGYLYEKETMLDIIRNESLDFAEKPMSFQYWRLMSRYWQHEIANYLDKTRIIYPQHVHIGILVSKLTDNGIGYKLHNHPHIIQCNKSIALSQKNTQREENPSLKADY